MARQGKMYGSPFHVETMSYAYAVEHENSGYTIPQKIIKCKYHLMATNTCELWNSGYEKCAAHKCRYIGSIQKRTASCNNCAFFLDGCRNPKRAHQEKGNAQKASYCCFYVGKEMEPKYSQFRRCMLRIEYTSEYKRLKEKISARNRTIRNFQKELQACNEGSSNYKYFQDKIKEKQALSKQEIARMEYLKEQLNKLGGPLEKWIFKKPGKRR